MSDEWHYSRNGKKSGPVSSAALRRLVETGGLTPIALVWRRGTPARGVMGLFATAPQPDPSPATLAHSGRTYRSRLIHTSENPFGAAFDQAVLRQEKCLRLTTVLQRRR